MSVRTLRVMSHYLIILSFLLVLWFCAAVVQNLCAVNMPTLNISQTYAHQAGFHVYIDDFHYKRLKTKSAKAITCMLLCILNQAVCHTLHFSCGFIQCAASLMELTD